MNKTFIYFVIIIICAYFSIVYVNTKAKEFSDEIENNYATNDTFDASKLTVKMIYPKAHDVIASPLVIKGRAPGAWFFEGTIFAKVFDDNDKLLGSGPVSTTEEDETQRPVRFEGVLPFSPSNSKKGYLIIEAYNLKSADDTRSVRIPVDLKDTAVSSCTGGDCGTSQCDISSIGTNGVCVHESDSKSL